MQFFYFLFIVSVFYMGCEEGGGGEGGGWGGSEAVHGSNFRNSIWQVSNQLRLIF